MDYFILESEKVKEQFANLVTTKKSLDEANMLFHQILASAYVNENLTYALVMLIDSFGSVMKKEIINKPKPLPQEKKEEE